MCNRIKVIILSNIVIYQHFLHLYIMCICWGVYSNSMLMSTLIRSSTSTVSCYWDFAFQPENCSFTDSVISPKEQKRSFQKSLQSTLSLNNLYFGWRCSQNLLSPTPGRGRQNLAVASNRWRWVSRLLWFSSIHKLLQAQLAPGVCETLCQMLGFFCIAVNDNAAVCARWALSGGVELHVDVGSCFVLCVKSHPSLTGWAQTIQHPVIR